MHQEIGFQFGIRHRPDRRFGQRFRLCLGDHRLRDRGGFDRRRYRRCGCGRFDAGGTARPRRIDIALRHHLDRQMARPAGAIPADQRTARLRIVEDHARTVVVDHLVEAIERVVGAVVQVDHQHVGAHPLQQFATEAGYPAFVHDPRAAFAQRLTQLAAQLGVVKQQGNRRNRVNHEPAPPHAAPAPPRSAPATRPPGTACRGSGPLRCRTHAGGVCRRCAR